MKSPIKKKQKKYRKTKRNDKKKNAPFSKILTKLVCIIATGRKAISGNKLGVYSSSLVDKGCLHILQNFAFAGFSV